MQDSWQSGDAYERFMGRWSRVVAREFLGWLSPQPGLRWLDVGCGSGALSAAVVETYEPSALTAVDQSPGFVELAQRRLQGRATCKVGDALTLPVADASVDVAVSGLVLNFIPNQSDALAEMQRVTAPGGTVAVYVWDYPGMMDFLTVFWDAVVALDPGALHLHEAHRFPDCNAKSLRKLFERAGFADVSVCAIDVATRFRDFDDYWQPFLGGQGPAPTYVQSLSEVDRGALRDLVHRRVPIQTDGTIPMIARAWAATGIVM